MTRMAIDDIDFASAARRVDEWLLGEARREEQSEVQELTEGVDYVIVSSSRSRSTLIAAAIAVSTTAIGLLTWLALR